MSLIKCPECDQEVSTEAKMCPHCGNPEIIIPTIKELRRSSNNAIKLVFGFIVLGLAFFVLLQSPSEKILSVFNSKKVSTIQSQQQAPVDNIAPQTPQKIIKKIGDTFVLWNMEYQVLSAVNKGSSSGIESTSGKFIEIVIKATNTVKTEIYLNNVIVRDNKGRQYEMNVLASVSSKYNWYGRTNNYKGIPAGFSETFSAVFEVPKDATGLELDYPSSNGPVVLSVQLGL